MGNKISSLVEEAEKKCGKKRYFNLILQGTFSIEEINSDFIKTYRKKAQDWQAKDCPESLHINHGSYLHKYGDSIEFIINELKNKPDSNRAVASLINCGDILRSGDTPIPSFMVLQMSLVEGTCIVCTAYFRALEVSKFLPVNLAEICLILSTVKDRFPNITDMDLTIHSFSAYSNPEFHCLEVADIDLSKNKGAIAIAVDREEHEKLLEFVNSKIRDESYIVTEGIVELRNALAMSSVKYNPQLINHIENALTYMEKLKAIRKSSSHSKEIMDLHELIRSSLTQFRSLLEELMRDK